MKPARLLLLFLIGLSGLRAATVKPARATGHGYELGRTQAGFLADVVLLNASPLEDIRSLRQGQAVVLRGRLFDQTALTALTAHAGPPTAIR